MILYLRLLVVLLSMGAMAITVYAGACFLVDRDADSPGMIVLLAIVAGAVMLAPWAYACSALGLSC